MSKAAGRVVVIFLTAIFLFSFYGKILRSPNTLLITDAGDGVKSYYSLLSHIKNDAGWHQTNAINYPYGEGHIFTDGLTLFAWLFKSLQLVFPFIQDYVLGFLVLFTFLSMVACNLLLFEILILFRLPVFYSIAAALLIGLLSPQLFRIPAHPSLGFIFFVPLTIYLLLRYVQSEQSNKFFLLLFVWYALSPFVHPYYVLLNAGFTLLFLFFVFVKSFVRRRQAVAILVKAFILVAAPVAIFYLYIHGIDSHSGRNPSPFGFFAYKADVHTVFAPHTGPFKHLFHTALSIPHQEWEGLTYVGTSMLLLVPVLLVRIIRKAFRIRLYGMIKMPFPFPLPQLFIASVLLLLLSFAIPFRYNLDWLLDYLPPLKQFRSIGRLAWVFYYVFAITAAYVFYLVYRRYAFRKFRVYGVMVLALVYSLQALEVLAYHRDLSNLISHAPNQFNADQKPAYIDQLSSAIDLSEFQGLLPLPFFHVGSDDIVRHAPDSLIRTAFYFAYHANMPMIASSSARTSIPESRNVCQLISPAYFKKNVLKDLSARTPVLVLTCGLDLSTAEQSIVQRSILVYDNHNIRLYRLPLDSIYTLTGIPPESRIPGLFKKSIKQTAFYTYAQDDLVYYDSFDSLRVDHSYSGPGAYRGMKSTYNILSLKYKFGLDTSQQYVASFWYYNNSLNILTNLAVVQEDDSLGITVDWIANTSIASCTYIDGSWTQVEVYFKPKKPDSFIQVFALGPDYDSQTIYIDELYIRKAGSTILRVDESPGLRIHSVNGYKL